VRFIDPVRLETIASLDLPGLICGLSLCGDDVIATADDRTISIIDPRVAPGQPAQQSPTLPCRPLAVACAGGRVLVSGDDRRIRMLDARKLRATVATTKPATKNGAVALHSPDAGDVVCVGGDESMTLVETAQNVGYLKRAKYLAEAPWVSAPVEIGGDIGLITRGGVVHRFTDIVQCLKSRQTADGDGDDD
jgi:hypothetical protein